MPHVDLSFRLMGNNPIPADHGYALYGAVSRVLPVVHQSDGIGIHPIRGRIVGERQMQLCDFSRLTIRIAAERMAEILPLAGKQLKVAGRLLRLGVPEVRGLVHATSLRSRLVTIKVAHTDAAPPPDAFLASLRRKLDALNISSDVAITLGKRRTLRLKQKEIVGYEVLLERLTAEESLSLQTVPDAFSRQHMGCGVFVPAGGNDE